jgi:predicted HTH transcriptional regulator
MRLFSVNLLATENDVIHSRTMKHFTLNEQQLELLSTIPLYQMLEHFAEPSTPSQVAKRLNRPANTVHYHVKRLVAAKLLRCAERNGRQCKYQRVSSKFRFHKSLLPAFEHQFPKT